MTIFSGVQPTGKLHIGNYLGAIKHWKELQDKGNCFFCIVDLHALTTPYEKSKMKENILEKLSVYLASGIDPEKSVIFQQSSVSAHTELAWVLSTITPLGDLERMTQFKEKSQKHKKNINAGLLNYPVLMAADILLYKAELVPVGEDQKQHIELARELARRFNARFGETFPEPQGIIPKNGAKIMSLKNPKKKMSKSDPLDTQILLFDEPNAIKKKISTAQTDSGKEIKFVPEKKPGISNLLAIYALFQKISIKEAERKFEGKNYKEFKEKIAALLIEKLKPFRNKREVVNKEILTQGAEKARQTTGETMAEVKQKMGLNI